jgi:hypothetical protein
LSRLIVPAHAKGKTEIEQRVQDARNVMLVEALVVIPGVTGLVKAQFEQPIPVEGVISSLVRVAFDALGQKRGNEIADDLLADIPDGLMN